MTTMATSVGSHASKQKSQKSIICGILKEVRKGSEVFFLFVGLFSSCTCNVERIYRRAAPTAKNEVGNQSKS